jgi:plasmid stabilization system protein ParE
MAERIVWTHQALGDLEAVCLFIQCDAPRQAQLFVERVAEAIELLALFPRSGRIVPEFGIPDYREVLIRNYNLSATIMPFGDSAA